MDHAEISTFAPRLRHVDREAFARELALQLTAEASLPALAVEEVELRLAALAGAQAKGQ